MDPQRLKGRRPYNPARAHATIDETGNRYQRLQVLGKGSRTTSGDIKWLCRCDCGAEKEVIGGLLRRGRTVSCGCFGREAALAATITHGMSNTPTYRSWRSMVQRCNLPNNRSYEIYGGRGIRVCERWLSFDAFLADMGERPDGRTLDRINNDLGYEPGNCRWATLIEQQTNRRCAVMVEAFGERNTLSEWSRRTGIDRTTLHRRIIRTGWEPERALTEAPHREDLTIDGVTKSLTQWARRAGITHGALRQRLTRGMTASEAVSTPSRCRNGRRARGAPKC